MATKMTLKEFLEVLIRMDGTFILRNEHGSMEFRGRELYLSPYGEWLTIYQKTPQSPESQSHLHLQWHTLSAATVIREEGQTPHLAFYMTPETAGEPLLVWYFPSFYDWAHGKAEIPANIAQYEAFVKAYGMAVQFVAPSAA
jgi:ATP adenylyltransferase/5',5'''-P-1,P-4-tetraphosphate phosphorylase II